MKNRKPRVSIGLPVYNGANFLEETLDSILAQTFEDFELIICDNASTDRTEAICRRYAARDRRVQYYRNAKNLGAARNYNRVFARAAGEYFKWAAHDDVLAPEFLEACVDRLDEDPSAVVCYPATVRIDGEGEILGPVKHQMQLGADDPYQRFADVVYATHRYPIFGLIRSDALGKTRLMESFADSDGNLLAELGLMGRIVELPEPLFFLRIHPKISTHAYPVARKRAVWFDTSKAGQLSFPAWRGLWTYFVSLGRVPLGWGDRFRCGAYLLKWIAQYRWRVLAGEVKGNIKDLLFSPTQERENEEEQKEPVRAESYATPSI